MAEEKSADAKAAEAAKKELADEKAHEKEKEKFERRSAITVAVLAAVTAYVALCAGNAGGDATGNTAKANDEWNLYQAKSMKGHTYEIERDLIETLAPGSVDEAKRKAFHDKCEAAAKKYEGEKKESFDKAKKLEADSTEAGRKSGNYGVASLFLQIAIVIVSVSILYRKDPIYYLGALVAVGGIAVFVATLAGWTKTLAMPY